MSRWTYRGRHRAPSTTRRTVGRVAAFGAVALAVPLADSAIASADTLSEIARCESGGDPTAQNAVSSASGLYQMIDSTWRAYGGSTAHARQASVAEQTAVARRLLAAEGTTPWNSSKSCWGGKTARGSTAPQRAVQLAADGEYTVQRGDTLSGIAAEHGRAWPSLWQVNRATVPDPHRIYPGQRLVT